MLSISGKHPEASIAGEKCQRGRVIGHKGREVAKSGHVGPCRPLWGVCQERGAIEGLLSEE